MRKLTAGLIAGATVTLSAAGTVAIVGSSPSGAAPPPTSRFCGQFAGTGPAPGCSYVVIGTGVVVSLRNNGIRPTPVRCDLTPAGQKHPLDSTTLSPGNRGSVSASIVPGTPRVFALACRSVTPGAPEVCRELSLTVTALRPTMTRTTTTRTRVPTRTLPAPTASPTPTTLPTTTGESAAPNVTRHVPSRGTTTTTTTTPAG